MSNNHPTVKLKHLVHTQIIPVGAQIEARHKGTVLKAIVQPDGTLKCGSEIYLSPSKLAAKAMSDAGSNRDSINGWYSCFYRDEALWKYRIIFSNLKFECASCDPASKILGSECHPDLPGFFLCKTHRPPKSIFQDVQPNADDEHYDICIVCGGKAHGFGDRKLAEELLLCDQCPNVVCMYCHRRFLNNDTKGEWTCPKCTFAFTDRINDVTSKSQVFADPPKSPSEASSTRLEVSQVLTDMAFTARRGSPPGTAQRRKDALRREKAARNKKEAILPPPSMPPPRTPSQASSSSKVIQATSPTPKSTVKKPKATPAKDPPAAAKATPSTKVTKANSSADPPAAAAKGPTASVQAQVPPPPPPAKGPTASVQAQVPPPPASVQAQVPPPPAKGPKPTPTPPTASVQTQIPPTQTMTPISTTLFAQGMSMSAPKAVVHPANAPNMTPVTQGAVPSANSGTGRQLGSLCMWKQLDIGAAAGQNVVSYTGKVNEMLDWDDDAAQVEFKNHITYKGGVKRNKPDGEGCMTFKQSDAKVRGTWKQGYLEGPGCITLPSMTVKANFKRSKLQLDRVSIQYSSGIQSQSSDNDC